MPLHTIRHPSQSKAFPGAHHLLAFLYRTPLVWVAFLLPLPFHPLWSGVNGKSLRGEDLSHSILHILKWYCTTPSGEACPWEKSYAKDLEVKRMKLEKNRPVLNHLVDGHVRFARQLIEWMGPNHVLDTKIDWKGQEAHLPNQIIHVCHYWRITWKFLAILSASRVIKGKIGQKPST